MFTPEDLKQIEQHGLTREAVEKQLENFRKGFVYVLNTQVGVVIVLAFAFHSIVKTFRHFNTKTDNAFCVGKNCERITVHIFIS